MTFYFNLKHAQFKLFIMSGHSVLTTSVQPNSSTYYSDTDILQARTKVQPLSRGIPPRRTSKRGTVL